MADWHHAPHHRLKASGAYMLTAATLNKAKLFARSEHLDLLQAQLFLLTEQYRIELRAWALFPNHYHLVFLTYPHSGDLQRFITHLHSLSARELNRIERQPGRKVWYQFWDTQLTYRNSYRARLKYVMSNPEKHGLVSDAKLYRWCSAKWFADKAEPGHYRTIMSYRTDKLGIADDF